MAASSEFFWAYRGPRGRVLHAMRERHGAVSRIALCGKAATLRAPWQDKAEHAAGLHRCRVCCYFAGIRP